ncbi:phospholipase A and acyltransferase 4-like isoform X2 [Limanda limanda]|uniref:phospholipase A and acyltransferase 4-like isoform X2 n=1 Tax=Limanda limanda TaxID=27771 RepID=UPI0029C76187|nr:phospholipase A and acyltransferase 4-like isoform X2 [Limanda limanda]
MAQKGDLIEISRGSYQHWAVYIGENEVVHLVREGGKSSGSSANPGNINGKVKREEFTDVVGNDSYRVNNLLDNSRNPRDPSIIVDEACAMVDRKLPYDLVTCNCEHFATRIRYGEAESLQPFLRRCRLMVIGLQSGPVMALIWDEHRPVS